MAQAAKYLESKLGPPTPARISRKLPWKVCQFFLWKRVLQIHSLNVPLRYSTPSTSIQKTEIDTLSPTAITSLIHQHKSFCSAGTLINEHSTPNHHHPHPQTFSSSFPHSTAGTAPTIPTQLPHTNYVFLPTPTDSLSPPLIATLSTPPPSHQLPTLTWPSDSNTETTPAPTHRYS